jgi:hypothetical protein
MNSGGIACGKALRASLVDQGFKVICALTGHALNVMRDLHDGTQ